MELSLPVSQALALFVKVIKKISKRLVDIQKTAISAEIALPTTSTRGVHDGTSGVEVPTRKGGQGDDRNGGERWKTVSAALEDELNEAGDDATRALKEKQREMIDALDLRKSV